MNVELVCTTDDPIDSLEYHQKIAADKSFGIKVLPTFRPDKAMMSKPCWTLDKGLWNKMYHEYFDKLEEAAGVEIKALDDILIALDKRHDFFHENGCRLSDHGLEDFWYDDNSRSCSYLAHIAELFHRRRSQREYSHEFSMVSLVLYRTAELNAQKDWTTQLHIGAMRNHNSRMFEKIGADTGFDSMAYSLQLHHLSRFFDRLDREEKLPKTIVYNLNPSWNDMLVTLLGNFQGGSLQNGTVPGKMQFGSGWWFLDQKKGMEDQLNALSNHGLLSQFVGMLTDSRSFLSYTRHEYFRRILCNLLGEDMRTGLLPNDFTMIGKMVQDICYYNAKNYFGFDAGFPASVRKE